MILYSDPDYGYREGLATTATAFPPFKKLTMYQESETFATDHTTPIAMDKTDNEVLAEFMGIVPDHLEHEEGIDYDWKNCPQGLHWGLESPPPFDKSWDWLMPVWYKFDSLKVEKEHHEALVDLRYDIGIAILSRGCAAACKLLAEGIKWYNTIKK